jgi:hypothetical protein
MRWISAACARYMNQRQAADLLVSASHPSGNPLASGPDDYYGYYGGGGLRRL